MAPPQSESEIPSTSNSDLPKIELAKDIGVTSGEITSQPSQQGKGLKTVDQVKKEGGKPTFENYAASALSGLGGYVAEHGTQITKGVGDILNTPEKVLTDLVENRKKPVTEQIKKQAEDALDLFNGMAQAAFGVASFTPGGAKFNAIAENIIPEKVNEVMSAPAHKIAEQFGYEPKEGSLIDKALTLGDVVGSLLIMKGSEMGAKKIIGEGELGAPLTTQEMNQVGYEALSDKIKAKEPLNAEESKIVANVISNTKPEELHNAIIDNSDKLKPLYLRKNKAVDIVEKAKEGKDIKKDIAKSDLTKEEFNQVVDLAKEGEHINEAKADELKNNFEYVEKAKEAIPEDHKDNTKIVGLVAKKNELLDKKKSLDSAFHPEIDEKIKGRDNEDGSHEDGIDDKIIKEIKKQKDELKKTKDTSEARKLLHQDREKFIEDKLSSLKGDKTIPLEKSRDIYGEMFDKKQKLKDFINQNKQENAIQEQSPGGLFQHTQEGIREQGSERGGVEQIKQGNEIAGPRSEQEVIKEEGKQSSEREEKKEISNDKDRSLENITIPDYKESFKIIKNEVFPHLMKPLKSFINGLGKVFYPAKYMEKAIGERAYSEAMTRLLSPDDINNEFKETYIKEADMTIGKLEEYFRKNYSKEELRDVNRAYGEPLTPEGQKIKALAIERLNKTDSGKDLLYFNEHIREKISDRVYDLAKEFGFNDIEHFKDYFYGVFEGSVGEKNIIFEKLRQQKLKEEKFYKTTERFSKEKTIATVADAEGYGLPLKEINPISNLASEVYAIGKRASMKSIKDDIWKNDRPFAVKTNQANPVTQSEWKPINDPIFDGYIFHPDFAKVVNNFIEVNALNKSPFAKALRGLVMAAQSIKFFGSAFHLFNELKASIASGGLKGAKEFGKSLVIKTNKKDPDYRSFIQHGGGIHYSKETEAIKKFSDAYDNVMKTALFNNRAARAIGVPVKFIMGKYNPISPAFSKAMFNEWIPAIKFQRFKHDKAVLEQKLGRELKSSELITLVKRQQEFFGEMNEKLYGRSGTVTALMRLFFMAPGYAEGNFMHQYRGVKELKDLGVAITKGEGKKQLKEVGVKNAAFVLSSLITTATMATIGTYLMTGKWPKAPEDANGVRDLFKVKTGQKDGSGDDIYVDMMTYDKDAWMTFGNLTSGNPGKIGEEIPSRLYGMESAPFKTAVDLGVILTGGVVYDYKGDPIYHAKDDLHTKLWKFIGYEGEKTLPISVSTFNQSREKGNSIAPSLIQSIGGFRPTTSESIKETKKAIKDDYSLRDLKRGEIQRINKIYATNPEEAEKQAIEFNEKQEVSLKQLIEKEYRNVNKEAPTEKYVKNKLKHIERGLYYISTFTKKAKKHGTKLNIEESKTKSGKPKKINVKSK